jgi:hypothetical protein
MTRPWKSVALALALAAGRAFAAPPANAPPAKAEPSKEQPAKEQAATQQQTKEQAVGAIKAMGAALSAAKTLRFSLRSLVPMKTERGDWFTVYGNATVMREGKDKLFVETGGDLFPFRLYYDGKTVTAFAPKDKIYAQRDAPGTIDGVLAQAAKNGEVVFVFADLVSADPAAAMTKGLQNAMVVGTSTIDGVEAQHLLVHGQQVDWEVWIGTEDRLPRMVSITDKGDARKPTQIVQLSDWALDAALPDGAFAFAAPADATKVPFRDPKKATAAGRRAAPTKRP